MVATMPMVPWAMPMSTGAKPICPRKGETSEVARLSANL